MVVASAVWFDIGIALEPTAMRPWMPNVETDAVGRLVFELAPPDLLPTACRGIAALSAGEQTAVDARMSYVDCAFEWGSAQHVESAQYRWAHSLKGRGGPNPAGRIPAAELAGCKRSSFGGEYYGLEVDDGTCLTVPVQGPGSGSSKFSIVRVGESPREWRERLLVNSAVIGILTDGADALSSIATARAPPIVTACGVIT